MSSTVAEKGGSASAAPHKPTFRERFHAWWEGYDLPASAEAAVDDAPPAEDNRPRPTIHERPQPRLDLVQALFGEGMVSPGRPDDLLRMVKPLGLDEKMTVVEIGAGLGGFARLVAEHTGAYVTAFEPIRELLAAGNELSAKHGQARKVRILPAPPTHFEARPKSVDALIGKEALLTIADKAELFSAVRKALKPGGQVTMTDYMLVGDANSEDYQSWLAYEPVTPHLLTPALTRARLEELGLEVRVLEDLTDEYRAAALGAFGEYAEKIRGEAPDEYKSAWALSEGELWSRRLSILQSGVVKLYRLYARLPGVKELT